MNAVTDFSVAFLLIFISVQMAQVITELKKSNELQSEIVERLRRH